MKRFTPFALFGLLFTSTSLIFAQTKLHRVQGAPFMGSMTQGSSSYPTGSATNAASNGSFIKSAGTVSAVALTLPQSCTITSIGVNWAGIGSGNVMVALYSDNSGKPGTLLTQSVGTAMNSGTGWQDITVSSYQGSPGTYWLASEIDANRAAFDTSTYNLLYYSHSYGSFDDTWSSSYGTYSTAIMRVTYTSNEEGCVKGYRYQYTDPTGYYPTYFHFYVNSGATGNFRLALYDDNSGKPNQLLWSSGSTAATAGADNSVAEPSGTKANGWDGTLTQNNYYWLMWQWDNTSAGPSYTDAGSGSQGIYYAQSYGSFPSTWSGGTVTNEKWTEYVNYSDVSLPVQATGFVAKTDAGSVTLSWETQSEVNNAGFNVLRQEQGTLNENRGNGETGNREDQGQGTSNWQLIASYNSDKALQGLGTSSAGKAYSFTDNKVSTGMTYRYKVQSVAIDGTTKDLATLSVTVKASSVPKTYAIHQNYPNPFNPSTTITYDVPTKSVVTITICDVLGRQVETLVDEEKDAGEYTLIFNGEKYASGIYFCKMVAGNYSSVKKMILAK